MKIRNLLTRAVLANAVLAAPVLAQGRADDVERGRQLFMSNGCYSCHGTVGQGGERSGAPRIAPDPFPFEAFRILVRRPRESMPRFDPQYLPDDQLQAIHRYLASIPPGPAVKDIPPLQGLSR